MNTLANELKIEIFEDIKIFFNENKACNCVFEENNDNPIEEIEKIFKHNISLGWQVLYNKDCVEDKNCACCFERHSVLFLDSLRGNYNLKYWARYRARIQYISKIIFKRHAVRLLSRSPGMMNNIQKNFMQELKKFDVEYSVKFRSVNSVWKTYIDEEVLPFKAKEIMQRVILKNSGLWAFYKSNPIYQTLNLAKKIGIAALSISGIKFFNSEPDTHTPVTRIFENEFGCETEVHTTIESEKRQLALLGSASGLSYASGVIQYLWAVNSEKTFLNFLKETVDLDILDLKTKISTVVFSDYVSWKIQKVKKNLLFPKNWMDEPALPLCQRSFVHLMFPSLIDKETDIRTSEDIENEVMDIERFYEIQEMIREREQIYES